MDPQTVNENATDGGGTVLTAPAGRVCFARKKAARYSR